MKDALLSELRALGCDTDGAMARVLDDKEFYIDCLNRCLDDEAFAALSEAVAAGHARAGFEHAHNLKGVTGMLGLTPLYAAASSLTEKLRAGSLDGAEAGCRAVLAGRDQIDGLMRRLGVRA